MSHTVDYTNITEGPEKVAKAMSDIRFYLGASFAKMHEILKNEYRKSPLTLEQMQFNCGMFLGIQGYPCQAWLETIKSEVESEVKS